MPITSKNTLIFLYLKAFLMFSLFSLALISCSVPAPVQTTLTPTRTITRTRAPTSTVTITPPRPHLPEATPLNPLKDSSCQPPCWEGIIPGVTTKDQVLQILDQSEFVNPNSIQNIYLEIDTIVWSGPSYGYGGGFITVDEDWIVRDIILHTNWPAITLESAIERWGEPDWIAFENWPHTQFAHFYYDDLGLSFRVDADFEPIEPKDYLYWVVFFDLQNGEKFCHSFSCDPYLGIHEWKGYGDY